MKLKSIKDYSEFNQEAFTDFIIENEILGFYEKPVRLSSGKLSNWYINWRESSSDAFLLDQISDFIIEYLLDHKLNPDCIYGIPEGGSKLAIITQYKWATLSKNYKKGSHIIPMGRGMPKKHGPPMNREFLGRPKGNVLLLEDVITTGGSLLKHTRTLRKKSDVNIIAVLVLTDRMEKNRDGNLVQNLVEAMDIDFHRLSDAFSLIPRAFYKLRPGTKLRETIEKEFKQNYKEEIEL